MVVIRGLELLETLTAAERNVQKWHDPQKFISESIMTIARLLRMPDMMRACGLDKFQLFHTPLLSDGHLVFFFILCVILSVIWFALHSVVFPLTWPQFRKIKPAHKKHYVLMNLLKSFILALQSMSFAWWWYSFRC